MWPTHYIPLQPKLEGVPPPRLALTTPMYPYELSEEMTSGASFEAVTPGLGAEDEITSGASFLSGVIQDILTSFDARRDEIESDGSFVSGILNDILVRLDIGRDEIESTAMFISGSLTDFPVVSYLNWPLGYEDEDLQSTGSFVSGVLA